MKGRASTYDVVRIGLPSSRRRKRERRSVAPPGTLRSRRSSCRRRVRDLVELHDLLRHGELAHRDNLGLCERAVRASSSTSSQPSECGCVHVQVEAVLVECSGRREPSPLLWAARRELRRVTGARPTVGRLGCSPLEAPGRRGGVGQATEDEAPRDRLAADRSVVGPDDGAAVCALGRGRDVTASEHARQCDDQGDRQADQRRARRCVRGVSPAATRWAPHPATTRETPGCDLMPATGSLGDGSMERRPT
jgi:hypothetical protein